MTAQTRFYFIIAAVTIVCSAILLAALTMALKGFRWDRSSRPIFIDFPSVTGIHVNSQVRYAGKTVGVVSGMQFLTWVERQESKNPANSVRVRVSLYSEAPPLYEGTEASIVSDTLLSEKFVDLIPRSASLPQKPNEPEAPLLKEGAIIQGNPVVSFDMLAQEAYQTLSDINRILDTVRENNPDFSIHLAQLISNGGQLAQNADKLVRQVDELLATNDPAIKQLTRDLKVISQNLKVTSTYAKTLTATVAKKPWQIVWGGKKNELPSEREILQSNQPIPIIQNEQECPSSQHKKNPSFSRASKRHLPTHSH